MERIFLGIYPILLRLPLFQCQVNRVKNKAHIIVFLLGHLNKARKLQRTMALHSTRGDINRTHGSMTRIKKGEACMKK